MSKKKRFVISQSLQQGLSETFNAVKNNAGNVRFEVIALSRIEPDPENPREMKISREEVKQGIQRNTVLFEEKENEMKSLYTLAETIKNKGLINPVVVYKHGENYRLVAGERRFLASIYAGKDDIQARILNEKPKGLDLRLLQWIENTEREDLSLKDRIGNVKLILTEYLKDHAEEKTSTTLIKELIGISFSQASCYIAVLNAPIEVKEQIISGKINNLDKAALISKIEEKSLRQKVLESCINGENIKSLKQMIEIHKKKEIPFTVALQKKPGRVSTKLNLGSTHKVSVVKKIILAVLNEPSLKHISPHFRQINWNEYSEVGRAFRKFLTLLEKEVA
jgi:ParB family chromosome partitioning protein